jgi:hypothetical protein
MMTTRERGKIPDDDDATASVREANVGMTDIDEGAIERKRWRHKNLTGKL